MDMVSDEVVNDFLLIGNMVETSINDFFLSMDDGFKLCGDIGLDNNTTLLFFGDSGLSIAKILLASRNLFLRSDEGLELIKKTVCDWTSW